MIGRKAMATDSGETVCLPSVGPCAGGQGALKNQIVAKPLVDLVVLSLALELQISQRRLLLNGDSFGIHLKLKSRENQILWWWRAVRGDWRKFSDW